MAPSILYVSNIISLLLIPVLFSDIQQGGFGDTYFVLLGLILIPLQLLMIIFFFISAADIKRAYPTMKQDAKSSRAEYLKLKKGH